MESWIGVDLDGTLADDSKLSWYGMGFIGEPVPAMLERVRDWLKDETIVKIVTARVSIPGQEELIHAWLEKHGLPKLIVTNAKDFNMIELWDDRCVAVERNTGNILGGYNGP